jgi:hypothetical protein
MALGPGFGPLAQGGTPPASTSGSNDNTFTGMATAVNPQDKTIKVKQFLMNRTFNVADNCKIVMPDKSTGSLTDLRPGQKLEVQFEKDRGVLIAYQITRQNLTSAGYIDVINPPGKLLVLKSGLLHDHFVLSKDCTVTVEGGKSGSLDELKPGQTVSVNYEEQNDNKVVRSIERQGALFSGTLEIIDSDNRIVRARTPLGTKKFNLANGCKIVVNGKVDTHLNQLGLGDQVVLCYDDVNGVLVANWISRENASSSSSKAAQESNRDTSSHPVPPGS